MSDIEKTLDTLAGEDIDVDLTTVEAEVWVQIDAERDGAAVLQADGTLGLVQSLRSPSLAVLGALMIGVAIGASSLQPDAGPGPLAAFSSSSPLAPSTLLGRGKG